MNPFVGMGNNPIRIIDPSGEDTIYYNRDGSEIKDKRKKSDDDVVYVKNKNDDSFKLLDGKASDWIEHMEKILNGQITFKNNVDGFDLNSVTMSWIVSSIGNINIRINSIRGENGSHKDNNQAVNIGIQGRWYIDKPSGSIEQFNNIMLTTKFAEIKYYFLIIDLCKVDHK